MFPLINFCKKQDAKLWKNKYVSTTRPYFKHHKGQLVVWMLLSVPKCSDISLRGLRLSVEDMTACSGLIVIEFSALFIHFSMFLITCNNWWYQSAVWSKQNMRESCALKQSISGVQLKGGTPLSHIYMINKLIIFCIWIL